MYEKITKNKIAKWRDYAESKSFVHIFLTGVLCLFYFYEKFIRYISRNAFFQVSLFTFLLIKNILLILFLFY